MTDKKLEDAGALEKVLQATSGKGVNLYLNGNRYFLSNKNPQFMELNEGDVVKLDYTLEGQDKSLKLVHHISKEGVQQDLNAEAEVNVGTPPEVATPDLTVETAPTVISSNTITTSNKFEEMIKQAEILVKSGLLPNEIKTPSAALAVMLTGQEIGIPVMQSLRSIYIVKGKPTLSAQLIGALIFRNGHKYIVKESTEKKCTLEFVRKGEQPVPYTFTIEDAERANLTKNDVWRQYPKAMLFSRAMSAGARLVMPDVIAGVYTPEEIADRVVVDAETGEQKPVDTGA